MSVYVGIVAVACALMMIGVMAGHMRNDRRLLRLWSEADQARNEWFQKYVDAAEELRDVKRGQTEAAAVNGDYLASCVTGCERDPAKRGGACVIAGTRFSVSQLMAELAEHHAVADLCDDLDLPHDTVKTLLHGMSSVLSHAQEENGALLRMCRQYEQLLTDAATGQRNVDLRAESSGAEILDGCGTAVRQPGGRYAGV